MPMHKSVQPLGCWPLSALPHLGPAGITAAAFPLLKEWGHSSKTFPLITQQPLCLGKPRVDPLPAFTREGLSQCPTHGNFLYNPGFQGSSGLVKHSNSCSSCHGSEGWCPDSSCFTERKYHQESWWFLETESTSAKKTKQGPIFIINSSTSFPLDF